MYIEQGCLPVFVKPILMTISFLIANLCKDKISTMRKYRQQDLTRWGRVEKDRREWEEVCNFDGFGLGLRGEREE